jgi:hypothetical protein
VYPRAVERRSCSEVVRPKSKGFENEGKMDTPILKHIRQVLEEHTLPLPDMNAGLIDALWLVMMLQKVEDKYRKNGTIE